MSLAMQSLAASPSSACTAPERTANRRQADEARAHGTEQGEGAKAPKGRHALLAALSDALEGLASASASDAASAPTDESSPGDRESKQALHAFAHELFAALRPAESEGRTGRGFAWGRTSSADFAQRLDALVQRLQGGATQASDSSVAVTPEVAVLAPTTAAATSATEPPATPSPTAPAADASAAPPTPAGVDSLLSAFQQLLAVRHPADTGAGATGSGIDALVAFLQRMSQSLGGQAASISPVPGTLLNVTA
jgi:hypothetical protein